MPQDDRWLPPQRIAPPRGPHRGANPQPSPDREAIGRAPVGPGGNGFGAVRGGGRSQRREPVAGQDDAGAFAGPVGPTAQVNSVDGEHHPVATVPEATRLLGDRPGYLDTTGLPDPPGEDAAPHHRRPHRRRGRPRRQQRAEDQHPEHAAASSDHAAASPDHAAASPDHAAASSVAPASPVAPARSVAAATLDPEHAAAASSLAPATLDPDPASHAAIPEARQGQAASHRDPGHRQGEPGPEDDPGRGRHRQRHPVHVRVGIHGPADRSAGTTRIWTNRGSQTARPRWGARCHATVTRSLSWSKRRWPMPGTSRSSSTVVNGWAVR
jgi:hypothetical protein